VLKDAISQQPVVGLLLQERGFKLSEIAPKLPPMSKTRQSIASSVAKLYSLGCITAGSLILGFSILFPIAKQAAFLLALAMPGSHTRKLLSITQTLHKWAMVDVFVLAMIVITLSSAAAWSSTLLDGFYWFLGYFFSAALLGILLSRHVRAAQAASSL
jgi:paraquat-inducible protein A